MIAPYLELAKGPSVSSRSIALPYAADSFSYLFSSLVRLRFLAFAVSLGTVLSDFLPLVLAILPFDRTTTWQAYVVTTWVSVGIIGYMIVVVLWLMALLLFRSYSHVLSMEELQENPLFVILHTLNGSPNLMECLHSMSELKTRHRNQKVKGLSLRYVLADPGIGVDQRPQLRIEVLSGTR